VQRNINGEWKDIAFVFSAADGGNSSTELSYKFTDVNGAKGITQYRILQVDLDGKGTYSVIRMVPGSTASGKLLLFPNPSSNGAVTVLFDTEGTRHVLVSDVVGRTIRQYRNITDNKLDVKNLSSGFYTMQVQDLATGVISIEKFIIK
jgi:hypothetical protein